MIIHAPRQRSKPRKLNAKQRELDAQWQALLNQHKPKKVKAKVTQYSSPKVPDNRSTKQYKSVDTGIGNASLPEQKVYTGDNVLGITIVHKSCLQPVFSKQEAVDAAKMRR